jgi:hypothetical protein
MSTAGLRTTPLRVESYYASARDENEEYESETVNV